MPQALFQLLAILIRLVWCMWVPQRLLTAVQIIHVEECFGRVNIGFIDIPIPPMVIPDSDAECAEYIE